MQKKATTFDVILYIVFALLSLIIIIPIWKVVSDSFNAVGVYRFQLWPNDPTFGGYMTIFTTAKLFRPFLNSVITTLVGTLLGLALATLGGYVLNQYEMPGRNFLNKRTELEGIRHNDFHTRSNQLFHFHKSIRICRDILVEGNIQVQFLGGLLQALVMGLSPAVVTDGAVHDHREPERCDH